MSFKSNIKLMAVSSLLGQLAIIVSGIISARILGPEDRGYLALVFLVPLAVAQLAKAGVPIAVTYFLSKDSGVTGKVFKKIAWICSMQSLLSVVCIGIAIIFFRDHLSSALLICALLAMPTAVTLIFQDYAYSILQGCNRFSQVAIARLLPSLGYAAITFVLWMADSVSLNMLTVAWLTANSLTVLIAFAIVWRGGVPKPTQNIERKSIDFLSFGGRAMAGSLAPMEAFRLEQVLGGLLLSPTGLGMYVVAQSFSTLPKILGSNLGLVLYTSAARADSQGRSALMKLFRQIGLLSSLNALGCLTLIAILPTLNHLFFGDHYHQADVPSQILVAAAWFASTRRFIGEFAKGIGYPELLTWTELLICPVLAGFAWLLCQDRSVTGLAIAVLISQIVATGICILLLHHYWRIANVLENGGKASANS